MKTKFLAIFALATVLMACDNQGKNEPKYVPGHEVILTVGAVASSANQVPPRMISGFVSTPQGGQETDGTVNWTWANGDTICVVAKDDSWSTFHD